MLNLKKQINKLKKYSFFLFITPMIGLLGTLAVNNFLINFTIENPIYPFEDSSKSSIICTAANDYCLLITKMRSKKLDNCTKYSYTEHIVNNNSTFSYMVGPELLKSFTIQNFRSKFLKNNILKDQYKNEKFKIVFTKTNNLVSTCIRNNKKYYFIYKNFPSMIDFINNIKDDKKYIAPTSVPVYPFFYGETSISNIVKRYPINYLFKPIMFLSSILMFLYWKSNNIIFNSILNENKKNKFFIYGVFSSIFLFFHVLFLGVEIDNSIFKMLRKVIIISFIIFEVMAQYNLVKTIYNYKSDFLNFIRPSIFKIKILLVSFILIATAVIIFILAVFDLTKTFDYFLEWNYFIFLLFFYLLSSIMWNIRKS